MDWIITIGTVGMMGAVLWDAARQDFDKKEISDLNAAALWAGAVFFGMQEVQVIVITSGVFSLLFSINAFTTNILRKPPVLSWGDILIIPPVAGIMMFFGPITILALLFCFFAALIVSCLKQEEEPMIPYIFFAFLAGSIRWVTG